MTTSESSLKRSRLCASSQTLRWIGLLGTALACNGSIDTQDSVSSARPRADTGSNNPGAAGSTTPAGTPDPSGSPNELGNDISGISDGASSRGGARGSRAARDRDNDRRDAGDEDIDAGVDDAGVVDAGLVDAGAGLADGGL
jgi:hypothetical protein